MAEAKRRRESDRFDNIRRGKISDGRRVARRRQFLPASALRGGARAAAFLRVVERQVTRAAPNALGERISLRSHYAIALDSGDRDGDGDSERANIQLFHALSRRRRRRRRCDARARAVVVVDRRHAQASGNLMARARGATATMSSFTRASAKRARKKKRQQTTAKDALDARTSARRRRRETIELPTARVRNAAPRARARARHVALHSPRRRECEKQIMKPLPNWVIQPTRAAMRNLHKNARARRLNKWGYRATSARRRFSRARGTRRAPQEARANKRRLLCGA